MALGRLVDTAVVVVAVPVTVLVVGATMIVVGSQEAEESVMVPVGSRLVPKLSVGVVTAVVELSVAVVCEVGGTTEAEEVGRSVSVLLGGSVTLVGRMTDAEPVGDAVSLAVEFSDIVGRTSVEDALVMAVGRSVAVLLSDTVGIGSDTVVCVLDGRSVVSVTLGEIVTSVGLRVLAPLACVPVTLDSAVVVGTLLPDGTVVSADEVTAAAVSVGTTEEPVPEPVNPPEMVDDRGAEVSAVDAPVADAVPSTSLVRLETSEPMLLKIELIMPVLSGEVVGDGVVTSVAGPVKPEEIVTSEVGDEIADVTPVPAPVMPEPEAKVVVVGKAEESPASEVVVVESDVTALSEVAEACDVTPVPAPVADASMVDSAEVVADAIALVTPDTTLLRSLVTADTMLLRMPLFVAEAEVVVSVVVASVEDTIMPLEVSAASLLATLAVDEDETIPVGPITMGVWVEGVAVVASAVDVVVTCVPAEL